MIGSCALPAELARAIVAAARAALPNEACGLLVAPATAKEGGVPTRFMPLTNAAASAYRYAIDPDEQVRALLTIEAAGEVVWGIVHSHLASPAAPSATDLELAFYPDSLYVICSLASDPPEIRAWSIRAGQPAEVWLSAGGSVTIVTSMIRRRARLADAFRRLTWLALVTVVVLACTGDRLAVPTHHMSGPMPGALANGRLILESGCVLLENATGDRWLVIWPRGYWRDAETVYGDDGVVAKIGSEVVLGGGEQPDYEFLRQSVLDSDVPEPCQVGLYWLTAVVNP